MRGGSSGDELPVWVLIPTAQRDHVEGQLHKWQQMGYKVGIWTDFLPKPEIAYKADFGIVGAYPGVWRAWNALAQAVFAAYPDVKVVVLAGDDMDPDPSKTAQEIAAEYLAKFPEGYGVMQPCGDPQGMAYSETHPGGAPAAARICGSPWVGRAWCRLAYNGAGPVCPDYTAFYADEELKLKAEKGMALWMRPDLSQFHRHWSWGHVPKQDYHERNQKKWEADKATFEARRKVGFPS